MIGIYPTSAEESDLDIAPAPTRLSIRSIVPNPFAPFADIAFETPRTGPVTLLVYDVTGRRVRSMPLGALGPGAHRVRWTGRDESGADLPSGVYFLRLRGVAEDSPAAKAVRLR